MKIHASVLSVGVVLSALLPGTSANACSRVLWNNNGVAVVTGRTMDWNHPWDDMVFVFPRGQKLDGGVEGGATWTSKYGSVVCSVGNYIKDHGFDYLNDGHTDGINEKGLAAHLLYLEETVYPEADDRPGVSFMRWVRYVLDNHATVAEAVEGMKKVRIVPKTLGGRKIPTHVAIEDPTGDSAIFEFIDGNLVIHHGKQFTVMTNDPSYLYQVENLKWFKDFGGGALFVCRIARTRHPESASLTSFERNEGGGGDESRSFRSAS